MTIIYLHDGYRGGAATFLEQNIRFNLKNKTKVILFDPNFKKSFPNLKKNKYLKIYNLHVFKDSKKIKELIKKLKISNQLFFFTNFGILIYYYFFFNNFKNKGQETIIALTLHSGLLQYNLKAILALGLFSILSLRLDYLIFGSHGSRHWWFSLFPWMKIIKNKVIYNGVKKQKIKKLNRKSIEVSFIGRLEKEHDPELFVDISLLNKSSKNINFNIFGDGSLKRKLLNKNKNIKFWGWCEQSKVYSKTDITVITSHINFFPYTALESNSYGIPVISSTRGDIRKIVKNNFNGYIFNERMPLKFNYYINKTIKNYKKLSKNSLINANKFNLYKSCHTIWRFLKIENNNIR